MRLLKRLPHVTVVVPAYRVEAWLPDCLASLVAQTYPHWEAVVVDDGSPDRTGQIAEEWAAKDRRIRVVHVPNGGLGAARNVGVRHARGEFLAFLDSDDVLPPTAYENLVGTLRRSGSDFVTGSIVRWEAGRLLEPPWMRRLHSVPRTGIDVAAHPEILGDVFAWNKLFRLDFWRSAGLEWPHEVLYEDQPTTTRAYLTGRFDVRPDIVTHWRIREDGTSITQQRRTVRDLRDRLHTKRDSLRSVRAHGHPDVERIFVDRVLAGDLHRYFVEIPGCTDEWWDLLRDGVQEFWGERSLAHSGLVPVHRLCGWLVERNRRHDATALMEHLHTRQGPLPRVRCEQGATRLAVPRDVLEVTTVDPAAVLVHAHEA